MNGLDIADPLLSSLLAVPLTFAIAVIDLRHRIIPNALNLLLLGLALGLAAIRLPEEAASAAGFALLEGLGAFALFYGFRAAYARARGRNGLGLGDVKFVGAVTPLVGLSGLPTMILVASLTGLGAVGFLILSGRPVEPATRLPFGPCLVLGLHATLLIETITQ